MLLYGMCSKISASIGELRLMHCMLPSHELVRLWPNTRAGGITLQGCIPAYSAEQKEHLN